MYVHQPGKELLLGILKPVQFCYTTAESLMKFRCMFSFAGFCTTGQRIVIGQRTVFYRPPIQEMFSKKTGSNSAKEQQLLSIHASFSVHFVPAIVSDAKCYFFSL